MAVIGHHYFQGKAQWVRLTQPDIKFQCWSVKLYLTPESLEEFKKLKEPKGDRVGILNHINRDEDGDYVSLKRPIQREYKGAIRAFTPPEILDAEGKPWQEGTLIGNGSDLTVKVEHYGYTGKYDGKKGSAIRMVSARVDNLVPYEGDRDYSDEQKEAVKGMDKKPRPF